MFTHVYSCLPMFTLVYTCLPMLTPVYLCLSMFTCVYICDPTLEKGAYGANYSIEIWEQKDGKL